MKFIADECVDVQIIEHLIKIGYEVLFVPEMEPGISDKKVLDIANRESAILITSDKDFGELVFRQKRITSGVILIRLAGLQPDVKASITVNAIKEHQDEIKNNFMVIYSRNSKNKKKRAFVNRYFVHVSNS
jgi:predicted nuclease of predicted toxin-antitoxin system